MINARLTYTTKYRQLHKVLKDEGTKRILHWHLSQSYRLTYVQYKVQGRHLAGGGAVRAFAPTFHEIQIVIRDLVSDIRGSFFFII